MKFNILALREAIDEWSMNMGAEDINVVVPDNSAKERKHLGLSEICQECPRAAWYSFRKIYKKAFPPRILRLFQRGHREEFFFIHMMRSVGLTIWEEDPKTGKQFKVTDFEGHLQGSMDTVAADRKMLYSDSKKPFLVEYKTYNDKRFKKLVKEGVKISDPKYYGQVQGYKGYEPRLQGTLFCAVNKNDDDIHFEWINPDALALDHIKDRAESILNSRVPLPRISNRKAFYKCKICVYQDHCFERDVVSDKSCRSCKNAEPAAKGTWRCRLKGKEYGELCSKWEDCNVR
tara:strand:+ start:111 stop:977 length:867 start_codon:yes stop_codon:yes gene_type:complete